VIPGFTNDPCMGIYLMWFVYTDHGDVETLQGPLLGDCAHPITLWLR